MRRSTRRSAWLAGLTVGVGAGVLSLLVPFVGWVIAAAFVVGALISRAMAAGVGGFLFGAGAAWLTLLLPAGFRCGAAMAADPGCIPRDLSPWLAIAIAMLAGGTVATLVAVARRPSHARRPNAGGSDLDLGS